MRPTYWLPSSGRLRGATKLNWPVLGSGMNLERNCFAVELSRDSGIRLPGNGTPVIGSRIPTDNSEKSPIRILVVGTVKVLVFGVPRSCVPCQAKKKKVLFFLIGPPRCAPN